MNNQRENVDHSAIDKENLDYFKTLLRHLQRIPDNKILLFRQEVDALLLKYAHHYVQNESAATNVREMKRRKYQSSDDESDQGTAPQSTPKADRRKSRIGQSQRKAKKVPEPVVSDDGIQDAWSSEHEKYQRRASWSPCRESREERERNAKTLTPCHQETVPTSAFRSGSSNNDEWNYYNPPQPQMPDNRCNINRQLPDHQQHTTSNGDNYNHFGQTRFQNEVTPGFNAASSAHFGYANASYSYQHQLNGREMQRGFYPPLPDRRHPTSSQHQYPSNNQEMPPGYYRPAPAEYGHSNPPYPPQNLSNQSNNYNSQVTPQNPANQQHASGAGSTQEPIGQNPHPPQHDGVHGAPVKSTHSITNTPENPDDSLNGSSTNRPLQLPKDSEQDGAI